MKIYCELCKKVQPVRIDNCRDAKTNEPYQDIVCGECDFVIASGTDIAQPEQESVICRNIYEVWAGSEGILKPLTSKEAYLLGLVEQMRDEAKKGLKPLYTAPPKREWIGLEDEDVATVKNEFNRGALWAEAKLKEKNT